MNLFFSQTFTSYQEIKTNNMDYFMGGGGGGTVVEQNTKNRSLKLPKFAHLKINGRYSFW